MNQEQENLYIETYSSEIHNSLIEKEKWTGEYILDRERTAMKNEEKKEQKT